MILIYLMPLPLPVPDKRAHFLLLDLGRGLECNSVKGLFLPGQVVAVDPDLGENGTLVYSIQPPNKFYSLNSTTGKIRTTHVMLDRENPDPVEAELMRKIIVSVTDCTDSYTTTSELPHRQRLLTFGDAPMGGPWGSWSPLRRVISPLRIKWCLHPRCDRPHGTLQ